MMDAMKLNIAALIKFTIVSDSRRKKKKKGRATVCFLGEFCKVFFKDFVEVKPDGVPNNRLGTHDSDVCKRHACRSASSILHLRSAMVIVSSLVA
jgi:hypothetical protein